MVSSKTVFEQGSWHEHPQDDLTQVSVLRPIEVYEYSTCAHDDPCWIPEGIVTRVVVSSQCSNLGDGMLRDVAISGSRLSRHRVHHRRPTA